MDLVFVYLMEFFFFFFSFFVFEYECLFSPKKFNEIV